MRCALMWKMCQLRISWIAIKISYNVTVLKTAVEALLKDRVKFVCRWTIVKMMALWNVARIFLELLHRKVTTANLDSLLQTYPQVIVRPFDI